MCFAQCSVRFAQQPKKIFRVGYFSVTDAASDAARSGVIRQALRELGYIEGQNIVFEYRYGLGQARRYSELATELVRRKVDVLVVAGADNALPAAKNATQTVPIVMTGVIRFWSAGTGTVLLNML